MALERKAASGRGFLHSDVVVEPICLNSAGTSAAKAILGMLGKSADKKEVSVIAEALRVSAGDH